MSAALIQSVVSLPESPALNFVLKYTLPL